MASKEQQQEHQQQQEEDQPVEPLIIKFDRKLHLGYFSYSLRSLPSGYGKLDTNRLTLVHFCVHALDLLGGVWDDASLQAHLRLDKQAIIEWIYAMQVVIPNNNTDSDDDEPSYKGHAGFKGGSFLGGAFDGNPNDQPWTFHHGHVAMTYTALCTLTALGDDLSRVDKAAIVRALQSLQIKESGAFQCIAVGSEQDLRFLYCACCISHMLNDWSGVDQDKAVEYILSCRSFDGALALLPGQEGHGGSTFVGVASLVLMQRLDQVLDDNSSNNNRDGNSWRRDLIHWCVSRQVCGMQGRPNKDEDTCYSYWIGATLQLLGRDDLLNHNDLRTYVMKCQTQMGGFSKIIGAFPDVLHAYYSLAYLSLSQPHFQKEKDDDGRGIQLKKLNCTLGVSQDTATNFEPLFP